MVNYSQELSEVIKQTSHLQLRCLKNGKEIGIPVYWHGYALDLIFFDPWSGKRIESSWKTYTSNIEEDMRTSLIDQIQKKHTNGICEDLSLYLDNGKYENMTSIVHIPNIRTYAILNKKEYGGWTAMDYCPFCGAKFPPRLDEELTRILQDEYGLESWKDYKKAPHEFHTDEWWKKRRL